MNGDRWLPARPNLEQYKKQAKDILKRRGWWDTQTVQRVRRHHPRLKNAAHLQRETIEFVLADAQLVIAREHGFESWPKFSHHIELLNRADSPLSQFESAVDAIVNGEIPALESLLRDNPALVRERSARRHDSTLLIYVGANGVEGNRQKTPKNAVDVAKSLLTAGSDVNAVGAMYGGTTTLGLVATSVHPWLAGLQLALIDLLLDHGAAFEGAVAPTYRKGSLVNACLANGRPEAAAHLARRGAPLDLAGAAGVGFLDVVERYFNHDGSLKTIATQAQLETAFTWACGFGRTKVAAYLLDRGADVGAQPEGHTGMHVAAYGGHLDVVKLLLKHNAPLETKDKSHGGGTPLGWALYAWGESP